jgi:hypothetical protein
MEKGLALYSIWFQASADDLGKLGRSCKVASSLTGSRQQWGQIIRPGKERRLHKTLGAIIGVSLLAATIHRDECSKLASHVGFVWRSRDIVQ